MMFILVIAAAFLYAAQARQVSPWEKVEKALETRNQTIQTLTAILSKPQILDRYWFKFFAGKGSDRKGVDEPVLKFSWNNCGSSSDPVIINKLTVSPDPVVIPGKITVGFDAVLKANVTSPLQVDLVAKKKVAFFWIDVPCVDDIGSCSYPDACTLIPKPCPEPIVKAGLPCSCPIPANHYQVTSATFQFPNIPLPSFIEDGDFKISATGTMKGQRIFCYELELSLEKS